MHKVQLRCGCHFAWIFGLVLMLFGAIALARFQVLLTYIFDRQNAVPGVWGYSSAGAVLVPCILAIVAGFFPVFYAMVLSRARAERRDAMTADVALKRYKRDESKELTAPRSVLRGEPPNPAMLNPIMDSEYAANFPPHGAMITRVDSV